MVRGKIAVDIVVAGERKHRGLGHSFATSAVSPKKGYTTVGIYLTGVHLANVHLRGGCLMSLYLGRVSYRHASHRRASNDCVS